MIFLFLMSLIWHFLNENNWWMIRMRNQDIWVLELLHAKKFLRNSHSNPNIKPEHEERNIIHLKWRFQTFSTFHITISEHFGVVSWYEFYCSIKFSESGSFSQFFLQTNYSWLIVSVFSIIYHKSATRAFTVEKNSVD